MSTTRFPNDRLVYFFDRQSKRMTNGAGVTFDVFLDAACTQQATITETDGTAITNSRIVVGADSLLPEFLDPGGHVRLFIRPVGGDVASEISAVAPRMLRLLVGEPIPPGTPDDVLILRY